MDAIVGKQTIIVDFDGTICEHRFPKVGKMKLGVREALTALREHYRIVIHSCRTASYWKNQDRRYQRGIIREYMHKNKIPYDDICIYDKPAAAYYIDDKAVEFQDDWRMVVQKILGQRQTIPIPRRKK